MEQETEASKLLELLASNKKELDEIVMDFLPKTSDALEIEQLYEMMRDYPSRGGKGLRGTTCLMWCELFGGRRADALITASALELFQNWILIHDDIEDQSDLRRGLPALHKKVGAELAINTGDALHGKMWELLLRNRDNLGSDLTVNILSEFALMLNATTEGQQVELAWTKGNKWNIKEDNYFLMVTKKSAWYTCITPTRLGILLASRGKTGQEIKDKQWLMQEVIQFGTLLGKSFQIIDDVLNLSGQESKYGKEILGDLLEGKRTLMLIHLLSHSDDSQKNKIIQTLSKSREKKSMDEVRFVLERMREAGSIDYAKKVAKHLSLDALSKFEGIVSRQGIERGPSYQLTRSLVEYLTSRDY